VEDADIRRQGQHRQLQIPSKNLVSPLFHRGAEIPGEHPRLEGDGKLTRTMRFADLGAVEAGRPELEAVIRAWCTWKE
jgi:hypothetical protein